MEGRKAYGFIVIVVVIYVIVLLVYNGSLLSGQARQNDAGKAKASNIDEPVDGIIEINYYTWSSEDDYMPHLIKEYERSQNRIKVNYFTFPAANYKYYERILVMLESNADIDVYGVNSSPFYTMYYSRGLLQPLTSYLRADGIDMTKYGTLISQVEIDGEYYALPHRRTAWLLFYNKDILDEEGIPYPEQLTWQEFIDLSYRLTKKRSDGTMQWGCNPYGISYNTVQFASAQYGESLADDEVPHFRDSLEILDQIYNKKPSSPPFSVAQSKDKPGDFVRDQFRNGEIVLYPGGDWNIATFNRLAEKGQMNINWDITYLPVFEGIPKGTTCGEATSTGIASYSRKKEAAWDFLKYMCNEQGAIILASQGILPAYSSEAVRNTYISNNVNRNVSIIFDDLQIRAECPKHIAANEIMNIVRNEVLLWHVGKKTMEQMLEDMNRLRLEIISKKSID